MPAGAKTGADDAEDVLGPLAMDGGDDVGERERFEHFKKRYREVEADFELCRPPMLKSKTVPLAGSGP